MNPTRVSGSCLCGRVQYEAVGPFAGFRYCHCERCRKMSGSAHTAHVFMPKEQLKWTAGENEITVFVHKDAENYSRAFCKTCGGPVPKLARDGKRIVIPAGTLDEDPKMRPTANIFWSMRAPWQVSAAELPTHDGYPPA